MYTTDFLDKYNLLIIDFDTIKVKFFVRLFSYSSKVLVEIISFVHKLFQSFQKQFQESKSSSKRWQ